MASTLTPEDYLKRTELVGQYPVEITSYRLGGVFYAKAEIKIPGAGARLAWAQEPTEQAAMEKVLAEARRLLQVRS
jgi:hypothetical protein